MAANKVHTAQSPLRELIDRYSENGQITDVDAFRGELEEWLSGNIPSPGEVEDLRTNEARFRHALEGNRDGVLDWDMRSGQVVYTPQWAEMLGYAPEDFTHGINDWFKTVMEEDVEVLQNALEQHIEGKTGKFRVEVRVHTKPGWVKWMLYRGQIAEYDERKKPLRFVLTQTDVTGRKKTEEKIKISESRLSALINNTHDMIWSVDTDFRLIVYNEAFREHSADLMNEVFDHGDDMPRKMQISLARLWTSWYKRALAGERFTTSYERKAGEDDQKIFFEISFNPIVDEKKVVQGVSCFAADVSKAREAEIQLRESREQLAKAQSMANMGSWDYDHSREVFRCSPEFYRMLEIPVKPFLTKDEMKARLHPGDGKAFFEAFENALENISALEVEHCILTPSGEEKFIVTRGRTVYSPNLGVSFRGSSQDISRRKRMEIQLRETGELLRAVNRASARLLLVQEHEKAVNEALSIASGAVKAEWLEVCLREDDKSGKPVFIPFYSRSSKSGKAPPKKPCKPSREIFKALDAGDFVFADGKNRAGNKSAGDAARELLLPMRLRGNLSGILRVSRKTEKPWKTEEAELLGNLANNIGGAVERHRIQRRILRYQQDLEEAQRIARLGGWEFYTETGVINWTPQMYVIHGVDPAKFTPGAENVLTLFPEDSRKKLEEFGRTIVEDKKRAETGVTLVTPGGIYKEVMVRGEPHVRAGEVYKISGIFQDVTRAREAERRLKEYAASLEKINAELDQFAYVVSHDLKAPLRAINNLTLWIGEDMSPHFSEETHEQFRLLKDRIVRMENLIEGILTYSRAGRMKTEVKPVNLRKLCREVCDMFDFPDGFELNIDGKELTVEIEELALRQVLSNLLGNALKYNDKGDKGRVDISWDKNNQKLRFEVADNGMGIEEKYRKKVFGMFRTLKAEKGYENTGIGLALVKKIVEEKGGKVELSSTPGEGSVFSFTWPAREDSEK